MSVIVVAALANKFVERPLNRVLRKWLLPLGQRVFFRKPAPALVAEPARVARAVDGR